MILSLWSQKQAKQAHEKQRPSREDVDATEAGGVLIRVHSPLRLLGAMGTYSSGKLGPAAVPFYASKVLLRPIPPHHTPHTPSPLNPRGMPGGFRAYMGNKP